MGNGLSTLCNDATDTLQAATPANATANVLAHLAQPRTPGPRYPLTASDVCFVGRKVYVDNHHQSQTTQPRASPSRRGRFRLHPVSPAPCIPASALLSCVSSARALCAARRRRRPSQSWAPHYLASRYAAIVPSPLLLLLSSLLPANISLCQTLIVPATIAFVVFLLVTFAVLPLWRRYRNRYSQYLPLDSLNSASLRDRIMNRLASLTLPSTWRRDRGRFAATGAGEGGGDSDGEELGHVDDDADGRYTGFGSDTVRLSRE